MTKPGLTLHKFEYDLFPKIDIERIDTDQGRYYEYGGDRFASVTTILSRRIKGTLDKWRKRVGHDEAKKISTQASLRGTVVHDLLERYLDPSRPKDFSVAKEMPINREHFRQVKPLLDKNVKTIYGIEHMMCSKLYRTAGTSDLLCDWDGINSVVDFKTGRKPKERKWIDNYFLQGAAYSQMVKELYGVKMPQIVIIVMVDHENEPQVFKEQVADWREPALSVFLEGK